jgi:hypothetical protein
MRLEGIDKIQSNVKRLQNRAPQLAAKVMRTSAIAVVVPAIRQRIKKQRNVFTGEWHSRMTARAGVENHVPFVDIGAFGVPYGLNLEKGSPPHTPDFDRVLEWVRKKLKVRPKGNSAIDFVVAARMVKSIELHGTKAHAAIGPAWRVNQGRFFADFVKRMRAQLAK